jgi:cytochrome b561
MTDTVHPAATVRLSRKDYYDRPTLIFHWLTAAFVLVLFGTALTWNYLLPHDRYWRSLLENTHVSLGILFAALIVARIVWRFTGGRRLAAEPGLTGTLSRIMYGVLYLLLLAEAVLGFVLRWVQGEDFEFFGLFSMPALIAQNRAIEHPIENLHNWVGWAIIILSAGHAGMALFHHYVLKDQVMQRMLFRHPVEPVARSV